MYNNFLKSKSLNIEFERFQGFLYQSFSVNTFQYLIMLLTTVLICGKTLKSMF